MSFIDCFAYSETLVGFARSRQPMLQGALTMAGTKSNLFRRVEMLLNDRFHVSSYSRRRVVLGFAAVMAMTGVVLASLQLTRVATDEDVSTAPKTPGLQAVINIPQTAVSGDETEDAQKLAEEEAEDAQANAGRYRKVLFDGSVEYSGHVFDQITDKPIAEAIVRITCVNLADSTTEPEITESTTDADGKYTFIILPNQLQQSQLHFWLDVRHPDYAPRRPHRFTCDGNQRSIRFGFDPWFTKLRMVSLLW